MAIIDGIGIEAHIIRLCQTSKDKGKIMTRLSLNDVQAESYLAILTRHSLLMQNNGKYVITEKGQGYLDSYERFRKIVSVNIDKSARFTRLSQIAGNDLQV